MKFYHISNCFKEGELDKQATVKESLTVQKEGSRNVKRKIEYYNLDMIISVGYRVKSRQGTQFRIWATNVLRDYMLKGFLLRSMNSSSAMTHFLLLTGPSFTFKFLFREKPIILTFFLNLTHTNLFWFASELNLSVQP